MFFEDSWSLKQLYLPRRVSVRSKDDTYNNTEETLFTSQWSFNANGANYPFDSPYPPAMARGPYPGQDRVVTLSKGNAKWNVSGLDIVTGKAIWTNTFPYTSDADIPLGITTAARDQNLNNTLNIVLIQVQNTVYALDGVMGTVKWNWVIPAEVTVVSFAGWNSDLYVLVRQIIEPTPDLFVQPQAQIIALNSSDGSFRWSFNTTKILPVAVSQQVQGSLDNLAAANGLALYARGNKLAGIDATTGQAMWVSTVNIAGGAGQGQAANITDMQFIQASDGRETYGPRVLTTTNNWSFQRFIMFSLNTTNSTAPPSVTWRTKDPETAMTDSTFAHPIPDVAADRFYYWSNRTDWTTGSTPVWKTYFVGKKLSDGTEVWSKALNPLGVPASYGGRVYVVTDQGLLALLGGVGTLDWAVQLQPLQEGQFDGRPVQYTYHTTATFGNTTGQLVAARCLGDMAPNLCMYTGFAPAPSAGEIVAGKLGWKFLMSAVLVIALGHM